MITRIIGAALFALALAQSQSTAPGRLYRRYGKKASEVYTNVQVLKDIDSTELIPTMQYMAESLGVGCDFCHVAGGSYKDGPTKIKARQMILMTREINRNHFGGEKTVSCAVCHRGSRLPVLYLPVAQDGGTAPASPPTAGASANQPGANQILDKFLQAVGGGAALQRISTRIEKGTISSGGSKLRYEVFYSTPNKRASIAYLANGESRTVFDGTSGWIDITAPDPPGRDMIPSETAAAKLEANLRFALDAGRILQGLSVLPAETVDGKEMYVVSGKPENMKAIRLYFDKQTGLLTRMIRYNEVPVGFSMVQTDYADYRDVAGVRVPFRTTQSRPGGRSVVQIESAQQNVAVDESRFNRPVI
jgi:outer membrane lipoprotein-sorting protein